MYVCTRMKVSVYACIDTNYNDALFRRTAYLLYITNII